MTELIIKEFLENGKIVKSAMLDGREYWFKFPVSVKKDLTARADPFLVSLIFPMMRAGGDIKVSGAGASEELLDNLRMFVKIWTFWKPKQYKPVNIIADAVPNDRFDHERKLITCFSGGLDAAYTAYKYAKKMATGKNYDYDKSVFVHGADIPLSQPDKYEAAFAPALETTRDIGVELVRVESNYREFAHDWEMEYGALLAGVLHFFAAGYGFGCCTNQSVHRFQTIWGLNPFTDRLLSSDIFRFFNDGYEHSRCDRAGFVKDWGTGVKNLRVCWSNYADLSKNCGHCEKCVRTKLNFMAHGVMKLPSMPDELSPAQIRAQVLDKEYKWKMYNESFETGIRNKTLPPDILRALEKKLARGIEKKHRFWRRLKF
ncbi:MAG: hypothetical protein LBL21_05080 [Rickettsiales bacterium]|jgi:hypothetical protein|nr:hypothetical protein [Rickettsiales bacterium]